MIAQLAAMEQEKGLPKVSQTITPFHKTSDRKLAQMNSVTASNPIFNIAAGTFNLTAEKGDRTMTQVMMSPIGLKKKLNLKKIKFDKQQA